MREKIVENILCSGKIATLIFLFTACAGNSSADLQKGLAGHWQLKGNTNDISGNERHVLVKGDVDLKVVGPDGNGGTAAGFNGLNAWLEIPADKSPRPGKEDFSIAVWINIGSGLNDVPGDILSQYDPVLHNGFQLSLKSNAVTTSHANALQLNFGIDNDQLSEWVDCGHPCNALCAFSMASFKGTLYAGTCEAGKDESGHVYRYGDANQWIDCGQLGNNTQTYSFAVYQGRLYVGTWPSGRVYRFEDINQWTDMGRLGNELVQSEPLNSGLFDLNNNVPLRIGFGTNDYFIGSMADLRLYNRSLNAREIRYLSDYSYINLIEKQ